MPEPLRDTAMFATRLLFSFAALILLSYGTSVFGEDYKDASGFSFTYPDGWILLTAEKFKDATAEIPEETKKWIEKNKIDLGRVKVMLVREPKGQEEFLENLNVVVVKEQLRLDDESVKFLLGAIQKRYETIDAKLEKLKSRVEKVGSCDALVLDYELKLPTSKAASRQRQIYFKGEGKTVIVSFTSSVESFDKYAPKFEKIVESFKLTEPEKKQAPVKN
jgi:hypothetical protein